MWAKYYNAAGEFTGKLIDGGRVVVDENGKEQHINYDQLGELNVLQRKLREAENAFKNIALDTSGVSFDKINLSGTNNKNSSSSSGSKAESSVSEALIEKDRYAQLNYELERTNVLLEKNEALQENTEGEKRNKLLAEETNLLKIKQNYLSVINNERRKERNELQRTLSANGVKFSGSGDSLTGLNIQSVLESKINQVNAHRNDKDKTYYNQLKAQYDSLSKSVSRFIEIQTKDIPDASNEWWNLQKEINGVKDELQKTTEDAINSYQNYIIEGIEKEIDALENEKKLAKEASETKVKNIQTEIDNELKLQE
jgi:hypothetical protein